jgi:hypothetical protein
VSRTVFQDHAIARCVLREEESTTQHACYNDYMATNRDLVQIPT